MERQHRKQEINCETGIKSNELHFYCIRADSLSEPLSLTLKPAIPQSHVLTMRRQDRKQLITGFERNASRSLICKWKRNFYDLTTSRGGIYHNSQDMKQHRIHQTTTHAKSTTEYQSTLVESDRPGARSSRRTFLSDWHLGNFHGSHLQSQVIICSQLPVFH